MRLTLTGTLLLALCLLSTPATTQAAKSYDNCTGFVDSVPAVITTQGVWCLRADLSTAITTGRAIEISTNNVTLDCNDFKLGGLAAGPATAANGIFASGRSNLTVTNCNVRGFYLGIHTDGGASNRALSNILDGNTFLGIWLASEGATIRGNTLTDTGGSSLSPGSAFGIAIWGSADITDNTVNSVFTAPGGAGSAYGIFTNNGSNVSISGNRVRSIVADTTQIGIRVQSSRSIVQGNHLFGATTGVAISCDSNATTAAGNVINGFATAAENCHQSGNIINPN